MPNTPDRCALEILDVVPLVMRTIRAEMRSSRGPDLSVPMFRALMFLRGCEGASLSEVAAHLGVTLPSMSKMVDGLQGRGLVTRCTAAGDRRRIRLALTDRGQELVSLAQEATKARLAELTARLPEDDRRTIVESMGVLRGVFGACARCRKE